MKVKKFTKDLLVTSALALTIAAAPASSVRAEAAQTNTTYTVERNDNLSKIAKKVYGDERLWRVIYNANSGTVKSDYIIYRGQVLAIPSLDGNPQQPSQQTPAPSAPAQTPAPAGSAPSQQAQSPAQQSPAAQAQTPTQQAQPQQAAADSAQEQEYVLDYNAIAPWVDGGFIGNDESGAPVVMALNQADDYAIIIFGDNSDMTAVSFVGPITFSGDYATITDETNGMALTFSVTEAGEGKLALDMGGVGRAVITAAAKESVLETIRTAIENYRHIA